MRGISHKDQAGSAIRSSAGGNAGANAGAVGKQNVLWQYAHARPIKQPSAIDTEVACCLVLGTHTGIRSGRVAPAWPRCAAIGAVIRPDSSSGRKRFRLVIQRHSNTADARRSSPIAHLTHFAVVAVIRYQQDAGDAANGRLPLKVNATVASGRTDLKDIEKISVADMKSGGFGASEHYR